jgi:hypothetical protein
LGQRPDPKDKDEPDNPQRNAQILHPAGCGQISLLLCVYTPMQVICPTKIQNASRRLRRNLQPLGQEGLIMAHSRRPSGGKYSAKK